MTDKDRSLQALKIVNDFMADMHSWEVEFFSVRKENLAGGGDDPAIKVRFSDKLEKVLQKFALKDKSNFGRLIDLGCTNPPTYDPQSDIIEVISVSDDEIVFQIQQTVGVEVTSRIFMVFKAGEWRIKKKESLGYDDKWKRSPL
ncbi:NTF2 fold immunity protein [Pseudomonas sp. GM74]|uniref:NTF2 fold immunity protein n=1 Tax=Pseudomonas sp. GM74 TaxID=1144336 RepID=UPI0009DB546D|nr:NTF2 fold immunity protein [Pseudomonas sp. GM74]